MPANEAAGPQSALLIVNRASGTGHSPADLEGLQQAFEADFTSAPRRSFQIADSHAEVTRLTQEFLASTPGPCCLLAGGGGGTTRALVHGLLTARGKDDIGLPDARIGVLRLGSGNLIAKRLGMPADPIAGLRDLADASGAGRVQPGWAYRCTFHLPDGSQCCEAGLALGSLGQFARVPAQVERWKLDHLRQLRWASRLLPLETINDIQYALGSLGQAVGCVLQPGRAELIEVRQAGRVEQMRLLAGVVLKFDLAQIPIRAGCRFDEPRLTLGLLPFEGGRQLLRALRHWPDLGGQLRRYAISPQAPLEIRYLGLNAATVALDEDTITTAARRLTWEVVGPLSFLPGRACQGGSR